jgi:hypothetical protein
VAATTYAAVRDSDPDYAGKSGCDSACSLYLN